MHASARAHVPPDTCPDGAAPGPQGLSGAPPPAPAPRHGEASAHHSLPLGTDAAAFALLNDRARQRMRGASTLDVTTGCTTTDIQQSLRAAPRAPP